MGCGSNPISDVLSKVNAQLLTAQSQLNSMAGELEKITKKAKKEDRKIKVGDLKDFEEKAKKLREVGKKMNELEQMAKDAAKEITEEKKKALDEKFGPILRGTRNGISKATEKADAAYTAAKELCDEDARQLLTDTYYNAFEEFRVITRRSVQ